MRIVVCLGGNALLRRGERPDADVRRAGIVRVATAIAALAHEHDLVVTHGNDAPLGLPDGETAAEATLGAPWPLDLLGARSQGLIGTLLVRTLRNVLPRRRVVSVITHTQVRADDPAFERPTTAVGPVYSGRQASFLAVRHGWRLAEDDQGWRRVVPAPGPERILESDTVRVLLDMGTVVVCAGGGGVPVVSDRTTGALCGVEAVVDKDLAAARLAEDLKADFLLILTDVPNIYAGYGTPGRRPVLDVTPAELRDAHYPDDSMGPKAEAAARFVENTGGLAAIGALDAAYEIVHGRSGTLVRPDLPIA
ncbi:carbamate kinase [Streptomyces fulvoviolaceus]|uniref:amino acid kinase family protein n=1 Tax=Streptomyces fulvoviolaceus TaxID=285535 RepID=UPI0004CA123E|nr:carbamate kinase [Streptomyces fulvoviolaceus]MCT9080184.1 carbamate kinase [Streptomyces fulvoviolaceus]